MIVKELKDIIQTLPDDAEINIKVNKYIPGNIDRGIIGHVSDNYDVEYVENYNIKNNKELILECTVSCN